MADNKLEGRREDALMKQRNQMREEFERQKQTLVAQTEKARPSSNRFVGQNDSVEESLKNSTIGLVKLEDFQQKKKEIEEARAREAARSAELKDDAKKTKKRKKVTKSTLSFAMDDEEGGGEDGSGSGSRSTPNGDADDPPVKKKKLSKNPNVDTSFLPDREREEEERKERERLRLEWLAKQEELKAEDIEITYSYWDGSGHRKSVVVCPSRFMIRFPTRLYPSVQER
ncbi:hypothetical protein CC2G_005473 [Coprinopsis cinerea AmutBmut pab1-1]|nr:hypothetical protein CC2G_005473 [Coprinopsis cinerea AmutBmut pab1-1]